jgi:hypothetical protein
VLTRIQFTCCGLGFAHQSGMLPNLVPERLGQH